MTSTDYEWLDKRLTELGYTDSSITRAVKELSYVLDGEDLSKEDRKTVTDLLSSVIDDRLYMSDAPTESKWVPYEIGETNLGDTIRVKKDAYEGSVGEKHNGKVGHIVGIRGGKARVQYLSRDDGVGHAHLPDSLEVLDKG